MVVKDPPLDEIQWRSPQTVQEMGGIHSNTVLHYFARSPFFEETSNNAVVMTQAMNNMSMYHLIQTREAFEGRLRTMAGLEFVVAQEPAETGPGMGTGVWVIRKQTRRINKVSAGDDVTVHQTYFVVGDNIYQSPTLADILTSRLNTMTESLSNIMPDADSIRTWTTALNDVYVQPPPAEGEEVPKSARNNTSLEAALQANAEESFFRHLKFGNDYMDEKIVTGEPGNFHFTTAAGTGTSRLGTGGKQQPAPTAAVQGAKTASATGGGGAESGAAAAIKTEERNGGGKVGKSPRATNAPKPKRRKSKVGQAAAP